MSLPRRPKIFGPKQEPITRTCLICREHTKKKCSVCQVHICVSCYATWARDHMVRCMEPAPEPAREPRNEPEHEREPSGEPRDVGARRHEDDGEKIEEIDER